MLQQTRIIYFDGSEEIIKHYHMFSHIRDGFAFYTEDPASDVTVMPYIFISSANVRKIIPMGAV